MLTGHKLRTSHHFSAEDTAVNQSKPLPPLSLHSSGGKRDNKINKYTHSTLAAKKCYGMFKEQPMLGGAVGCEVPKGVWRLTPQNLVAYCTEFGFYSE